VLDYVLRFKDAYLASISRKSGSLGIFAVFILMWVGVQTFTNIDRCLNHIWSSDRERPFLEQFRNFLVVSVVAPLALIAALSLPLILQKAPGTHLILERVPLLNVLMNMVVVPLIVLVTFFSLYRFVPVRRVKWRPALGGAIFATVCLQLVNWLMRIYFAHGTNTAYGKAAVVPLILFWIYIVLMVVLLGAEVSFLMQNGRELLDPRRRHRSLQEGQELLQVLAALHRAYRDGSNPVEFERLKRDSRLDAEPLQGILDYLCGRGFALGVVTSDDSGDAYALGREVNEVRIADLLKDFFREDMERASESQGAWQNGLSAWLDSFGETTITQLAPG
jgi:membrane protein